MDPVFYAKEWLLSVLDFVERHLFANCDLYGFIEFVKWDRSTSASGRNRAESWYLFYRGFKFLFSNIFFGN